MCVSWLGYRSIRWWVFTHELLHSLATIATISSQNAPETTSWILLCAILIGSQLDDAYLSLKKTSETFIVKNHMNKTGERQC